MSRRYMLDTDTVSYAFRGVDPVQSRLARVDPARLCISAITLAELRVGAEYRRSRKLHRAIDGLLSGIEVLPFDELAAGEFGRLGAALASVGRSIGQFDTLIAAHALSIAATLVTNNVAHFSRVEGLRVENWLEA